MVSSSFTYFFGFDKFYLNNFRAWILENFFFRARALEQLSVFVDRQKTSPIIGSLLISSFFLDFKLIHSKKNDNQTISFLHIQYILFNTSNIFSIKKNTLRESLSSLERENSFSLFFLPLNTFQSFRRRKNTFFFLFWCQIVFRSKDRFLLCFNFQTNRSCFFMSFSFSSVWFDKIKFQLKSDSV